MGDEAGEADEFTAWQIDLGTHQEERILNRQGRQGRQGKQPPPRIFLCAFA
jgi:hypothetical protein